MNRGVLLFGTVLLSLAVSVSIAHSRPGFPADEPEISDVAALLEEGLTGLANDGLVLEGEALDRIGDLIGEARIVALGEATHGTMEESFLRRQIVEYLVREKGFSLLAIEDQVAEAALVDRALRDPSADPVKALDRLQFWPWKNKEMERLIEWMHERARVDGEHTVRFHGFEVQNPFFGVQDLGELVGRFRPDLLPAYEEAAGALGGPPASGFTRMGFPAESFEERDLAVTVPMRVTDALDGWASFIVQAWRAEPTELLKRRNVIHTGSGSSDWVVRTIDMSIPEEADWVDILFVLQGDGAVSFDEVRIESAGGAPIARIGFDDENHPVFLSESAEFDIEVVTDEALGREVLRIASKERDLPDGIDVLRKWSALLEDLINIPPHVEEGMPGEGDEEYKYAIRLAANVRFHIKAREGQIDREIGMAENIALLLDHEPGRKIILWAHNGHVAMRSPIPGLNVPPMGAHLRKRFGNDYFVLGFVVGSGTYRAVNRKARGVLGPNPFPPAVDGSIEKILLGLGSDLALLPITGGGYPTARMLLHQLPGSNAVENPFYERAVFADYDAIIWIPEVTASEMIDFEGRR